MAPIQYIIADGWDVGFYSRKEDAERYMEAIDVRDGIYKGYDADGRLLKISPFGPASKIELAETEPHHADDLIELLIGLLVRRGLTPTSKDLPGLLSMFEPSRR